MLVYQCSRESHVAHVTLVEITSAQACKTRLTIGTFGALYRIQVLHVMRIMSYIRVFGPQSGIRDVRPRSCEAAKRGIIINALNARTHHGDCRRKAALRSAKIK